MDFSKDFLNQFDPIGTLGEGGMARVILARQKSLERQVAIKFMAGAAFPASEAMERFNREAQMLAKLDHPNVLKIYDLGIEDAQPFLVLEYVRGESVRERLAREGPLKSDEAGRIALMVARGLAYAHDKAILHRDVKPENVLLSVEGGVKLLDFGLGKLLELSENISHGGVILGTPAYLAPELIMGRQPSEGSDLYTVGVLLYEMLCAKTPFGDSAEPDKLLERTKVESPLEPLGEVAADKRLVDILAKSLRRDPEERFQAAHELVESLELYLGVSADPRIRRSIPGMMRPGSRARSGAYKRNRPGSGQRVTRVLKQMPVRPFIALGAITGALTVALVLMLSRPSRQLGDAGDLEVLSGIQGARVRWRSNDPYIGSVSATSPGLPEVMLREAQPTTEHDVLLTSLKRARLYDLKVGDESGPRYPPQRFNTAERLEIPPVPNLEATDWDRATVTLELNVPATVVARPSAGELVVSGGERPQTTQKLTITGPGAGVGQFSLDLDITTVEGSLERRTVMLRGAYESLSEYVHTATFLGDLEVVDAAWQRRAPAEDALIAARTAVADCHMLRTKAKEISRLAHCLTEPGVSFPRAARIYELLSELERFNRIIPARIAHMKGGKFPLGAIPPLVPVSSAIQAFAQSSVENNPGDSKPALALFVPAGRIRPSLLAAGQDVTAAAAILGDLPTDPKNAPAKLPFDSFMDELPDEGRVRVTLKGRCLSSVVFLDLEVNGDYRLRFFGAQAALEVPEPFTTLAKMATPSEFEKAIPPRELSLTVPVKMFRRGKNSFVLSGGIVAPPMASVNGPCVPVLHWVGWQPLR